MPKLTKRVVDAAQPDPDGRRVYVWDSEISGFGLAVLPSGGRSFVMQYRTAEGRTRRTTIGRYGDWTVEQARKRAGELRDRVKAGDDPVEQKRDLRASLTVGDLLDLYFKSDAFRRKAETTQKIDRGRVRWHIAPTLGAIYLHKLRRADILRARDMIEAGKTAADQKTGARGRARVKGGPVTARDCIGFVRAVLSWAVENEIGGLKANPAAGIKLPTSNQRDTIIETADDYARLFGTLERMEAEKRLRAPVADAIRLIALVGCRPGEAVNLRWRHVDLRNNRLVLDEHKTKRATGKARIIRLPAVAQEIVARQAEGEPDDYVFRPAKGDGPVELKKIWRTIRTEAELPPALGLHGLRHSVGSHLAMGGAQAAELMAALGHTQVSTTMRYVHFAEAARNQLAERAASVALAGMAKAARKEDDAPVVPLRPGGAV